MKLLFHFLILTFLFSTSSMAYEELHIIQGIPHSFNIHSQGKIVVGNKQVLKVLSKSGGQVSVVGVTTGQTTIKTAAKNYIVQVFTPSQKIFLDELSKTSYLQKKVHIAFEGKSVLLIGRLSQWKEVATLLTLLHKTKPEVDNQVSIEKKHMDLLYSFFNSQKAKTSAPLPEINLGKTIHLVFPEATSSEKSVIENHYGHYGFKIIYQKSAFHKRSPIYIDIFVTEINRDYSKQLGIDWKSPSTLASSLTQANDHTWLDRFQLMESQGGGQLLAYPQLQTVSGQEVKFQSGGELGIKTHGYQSQSIYWKPYGIIIEVVPTVSTSKEVSLSISIEISNPDPTQTIDGVPALKTNKVSTKVIGKLNQGVLLSGILQNRFNTVKEGIIGLGSIPILGRLFSSENYKNNHSEFFILVVPKSQTENIKSDKNTDATLTSQDLNTSKIKAETTSQSPRGSR